MEFHRVKSTASFDSKPYGSHVPYVLSDELATAVNLALALGQPLLVTGEPGCGKSTLADEVARQLKWDKLGFYTKSTSNGRDLLYTYDMVRRFHDARSNPDAFRAAESKGIDSPYIKYVALGEAIKKGVSHVILVDEIDKAPRDFANDLLREIDEKQFRVEEIDEGDVPTSSAEQFILITSNEERELPEAFLRRCVYAHIDFPDETQLLKILSWHNGEDSTPPALLKAALGKFRELRDVPGLGKSPSTAELIVWVKALRRMAVRPPQLSVRSWKDLPALGALIKTKDDLRRVSGLPLKAN